MESHQTIKVWSEPAGVGTLALIQAILEGARPAAMPRLRSEDERVEVPRAKEAERVVKAR